MSELFVKILGFFVELVKSDPENRSRLGRFIRSRPVHLIAAGLLLAAECCWLNTLFPFESSIANHLLLIPAATVLVCARYPQWWRWTSLAALLIQAIGAAAYLPIPPRVLPALIGVVGGNVVLCALTGMIRQRSARRAAGAAKQKPEGAHLSRRALRRQRKQQKRASAAGH
jgi:hypothetical protein